MRCQNAAHLQSRAAGRCALQQYQPTAESRKLVIGTRGFASVTMAGIFIIVEGKGFRHREIDGQNKIHANMRAMLTRRAF